MEGTPAAIDEVVETALDEHERGGDDNLRARTAAAVSHAAKTLEPLQPIAAEAEFDTTVAGVHVGGFIDLIARDADGTIMIVDYKTGGVPDEYYALQLALYRAAVSATYPETKGVILRISEVAAEIRAPDLPGIETMEQQVAAASTMREDIARTGIHCRSCPYAGGLCPEGSGAIEALGAAF
jgi:predicted RecB family nuclease